MKKQRVGKPITVNKITVIPLEEDTIYCPGGKGWACCYVSRIPVGIVMVTPEKQWACDISGERVPLANFVHKFDGLQEIIDNI